MNPGDKVWVRRGSRRVKDQPGCERRVRGTLVSEIEHQREVRLEEDDPYDTVGWRNAGDVGWWCTQSVTHRKDP